VAERGTGGHAHLHVWWFGPYLESALLQAWWGELVAGKDRVVPQLSWREFLAGARQSGHVPDGRLYEWLGKPPMDKPLSWGIVDIRSDKSSSGALAAYTQKVGLALYNTKGTDTSRIEPAHAASIYETLEGVRAVQWARGWAPPKKPMRARCVTFRRLTEDEKARLNRSVIHRNQKEKTGNENQALDSVLVVHMGVRVSEGPPEQKKLGMQIRLGPAQLLLAVDIRKRSKYRKSW
jgi:hypothetical protein